MSVFIETIVARSDGKLVTTRQRVGSVETGQLLARVWANGYQPISSECWCPTCTPIITNDFGENVVVQVQEYSPEARVKEGLEII